VFKVTFCETTGEQDNYAKSKQPLYAVLNIFKWMLFGELLQRDGKCR